MIPELLIVIFTWLSPEVTTPVYVPASGNGAGMAVLICPMSLGESTANATLCGYYTKAFCPSPQQIGPVSVSVDQGTRVRLFRCGQLL